MKDLVLIPLFVILGAWVLYYFYSGQLFDFILSVPSYALSLVLSHLPYPPDLPYGYNPGPIFQENNRLAPVMGVR